MEMITLSIVLTYPCHSSSFHSLGARLLVISLAEYLRLLFGCYFPPFLDLTKYIHPTGPREHLEILMQAWAP